MPALLLHDDRCVGKVYMIHLGLLVNESPPVIQSDDRLAHFSRGTMLCKDIEDEQDSCIVADQETNMEAFHVPSLYVCPVKS